MAKTSLEFAVVGRSMAKFPFESSPPKDLVVHSEAFHCVFGGSLRRPIL